MPDKLPATAKHTPGDWQQNGSYIYGPDPDRILIAQMCYGGSYKDHHKEHAANEALILTAPKLLELANALCMVMAHEPEETLEKAIEAVYDKARFLIAKVEGAA